MRFALALSTLVLLGTPGVSSAAPLVCPVNMPTAGIIPVGELASMIATGDLAERSAQLTRIVAIMRDRGMVPSGIVDSLIAAYCPVVAASAGITDQQKTANVRAFAAQVVRAAYAFDDAEQIILDVALPPAVVKVVTEKAAQQNVTPQDWAATAVTNAAGAPR